jgi:hypothetical protein
VKSFGLTKELLLKLAGLRLEEESGIPGVRVKSVDIGRNTSGESGSLVWI